MKNLFLDIGNTSINYAFTYNRKIISRGKISTSEYGQMFSAIKKYYPKNIIIASVVPEVESRILKTNLRQYKIFKIGKDIPVPVKNKYLKPHTVGIDRLLNAYYIKEKNFFPAICIDIGTAITIDIISSRGEFCGGLIFPGVELCYQVLGEKTSLLPGLKPKKLTTKIYGRSTEECIHLGIIKGISSLLKGVTEDISKQLKNKWKKPLSVFVTGGNISSFISIIKKNKWKTISDMTLKSMILLWAKYCKK